MSDKELTAKIYESVREGNADPAMLQGLDVTILMKVAGRIKKSMDKAGAGDAKATRAGGEREGAAAQAGQKAAAGPVRIAVLGSYSIQHFVSILKVFLMGQGMDAVFYEGEYDGIRMDVLNPDSAFYAFEPDMVLLLMDHRDIHSYPPVLSGDDEVVSLAAAEAEAIASLWEHIHSHLKRCHIIQTNIALPPERVLGNLEGSVPYGRQGFLRQVNEALSKRLRPGVSILDMEFLASYIGRKQWFDYPSYFLTKAGFSPDCLPVICASFARLIGSLSGRVYKCVVLDLDNTLWGGVVGDLGWEKIELDPHNAVGEAYRHFQSYLKALRQRGVLLAVCSKNEEAAAREPFEKNRNMILGLEDIDCFVANWEDKASNIRSIAKRLNIGVDSLVFVDDNPAEREIVRSFLPRVLTVELPDDPAYYARALDETGAFSWTELTGEDVKRAGTYAANAKREALMESFVDYDSYLKALEMKALAGTPAQGQIKRFAQLINKSNQFNLRTIRYGEEDVADMLSDESRRLICVELTDKFSEYGIISCIILEKQGDSCFIDTWLMSCRVLKRGVEYLALDRAVKAAGELGCGELVGEYIPTKKNAMVKDFYPSLGFSPAGEGRYCLKLSDYRKRDYYIEEL